VARTRDARIRSHRRTSSARAPRAALLSILAAVAVIAGAVSVPASADPGAGGTCPPGIAKNKPWLCPSNSPAPSPSATLSASPSLSPTVQPSPTVSPTSTTASPTTSPAPSSSPSPTPSPTPTAPPPGGLTNCYHQLDVCGYPTAESTGVQDGITLTRSSGDIDITTAGTVLANREITGCIYVHAANVVIRNVRLLMADRCFYGISTYDVPSSGPVTIENSEVICTWAHGSALAGPNFRASRLYLSGCENGVEINGNSQISDSWIAGSEVGNANAHGDDIQSQGGSYVVIRHNTFAGVNPITSSIITNPTGNSHWLVEGNIMRAGAYMFYCPEDAANGDFVVRDNRLYPYRNLDGLRLYADLGDNWAPAYGQTDACAGDARITWTGNYDEYLRPVPAGGLN
jgi:hypothetical protein